MPEGLLMYSCLIADILQKFAKCECIIMGDITYGACCIEDVLSKELNADLLIHYGKQQDHFSTIEGHSCLIPITETKIKTLYVFVEIGIDLNHFVKTIQHNFQDKETR